MIAGFGVLSVLFGANHLAAALKSPRSWSNWLGAASNAVALATGLAALDDARPGKAKPPA